jgi:hypothetical protein
MLVAGCIDSWTRGSTNIHHGPVAMTTALLIREGPVDTPSRTISPRLLGERENDRERENGEVAEGNGGED